MPHQTETTIVGNALVQEAEVPVRSPVAWQKPGEMRILNKDIRRVDGPAKVTGRAKYTYDVNLPGLLHARVLRSPYAAARIASPSDVDISAAQKIPGVKAILNLVEDGGKTLRYQGDEVCAVA